MAYGTVSADVIQSSVSGVSLGAGNASIMKNRIINGAMVIDQRNAGASVTPSSGSYTLDRWQAQSSQSSKYSVQQNAGSVTPPAGFKNYLGVTSLSAYSVGASDAFWLQQAIEGYNSADLDFGTANAKTVTLSFWVRSSLTGTFGGALTNSATDRSYVFSYTVNSANTWEQKSITITGDTSGTWLTTNGIGVLVRFSLGMGSTYSTTAGSWTSGQYLSATGATSVVGTSGATFYITGVQLEVGSNATGFEYVNYQTSLANCQRYYSTFWFAQDFIGSGFGSQGCTYPVTMRATPTLALVGSATQSNVSSINAPTNGSLIGTTGATLQVVSTNPAARTFYYALYSASIEL